MGRWLRVYSLTVAFAVALAAGASAADCLDYTDFLHVLGATGTPGSPTDVAIAGDLALVTDTGVGLHLFDVADPALPRLLGVHQADPGFLRVITAGSYAYAADIAAQLLILDLADPADPRPVASIALPANGRDFHREGDLLLVACGEAGLVIFDIVDPAIPQALATLDTPGNAYGVAAVGPLAVIADGDGGLRTVDIADPANPRILGALATADTAFDVVLADEVAHIACDAAGLELVAVADPAAPVSLSTLPLPGLTRRVAVAGDLTCVVGGSLKVVDTSDPFGPVLLGRAAADNASSVSISDTRVYLSDRHAGLVILDAANPTNPPPISLTGTAELAYGVASDGPLTYLAAGDLLIYDHTDPEAPQLVATAPIPGTASRLALAAGHAYVTSAGLAGLMYVVDIADPTQPVVVDEVTFPGYPGPILAHGGALYLGDFLFGGLYVLDLADPAQPQLLPTVPTGIYAIGLAAAGDRLYVATGAFGGAAIEVRDVTDPLDPALLHVLATDHDAIYGLHARGDLLYTAHEGEGGGGLTILDFAQPTAPVELSRVPLPGDPNSVALAGDVAYTASEQRYLHVIDVADPTAPIRLGETPLPGTSYTLAAVGDRVHVAATYAGLVVMPGHCDGSVPVLEPGDGDPPPEPLAARLTAFPNPFNPQVTLRFTLPRAAPTHLDVFDLAGRRVARLLAGDGRPAGEQSVTWRPVDLPSGTYLARLETPELARVTKLVLVR